MNKSLSRRDLLRTSLAAGALAAAELPILNAADPKPAGMPFRFVHFTDVHVQRELKAAAGLAQALKSVNELKPAPDFILTGGDNVYDVLGTSAEKAKELFALWKRVIADNTNIRVIETVGNHDVFGWANQNGVTPQTPGYGKALCKESLGLKETYHTFDHKGWRFFVLDNIQPGHAADHIYTGYLDKPQAEWLAEQLKRTDPKMPCVFCQHIPSLTVTGFGFNANVKDHGWRFDGDLVCEDTLDRLAMLKDRSVKLWLSGHIHQLDRIDYRNTTFICDGAVCGSWWKGPHNGVPEGYGVFDCRPDGTFDYQYKTYGWQAVKE